MSVLNSGDQRVPKGHGLICDFELPDGMWEVRLKLTNGRFYPGRRGGTDNWINVHVSALGGAAFKANYWLGWNGHRLSRPHDYHSLAKRPALKAELIRQLAERFPPVDDDYGEFAEFFG